MRFIKKHKYKLLTLMLSIVSIFTLFIGINKTYAYETDVFSDTCNAPSSPNTNLWSVQENIDNYEIKSVSANQGLIFDIYLKNSYLNKKNKSLLINFNLFWSNNNNDWNLIEYNPTTSTQARITIALNNENAYNTTTLIIANNLTYNTTKNYYSNIYTLTPISSLNSEFTFVRITLSSTLFNSGYAKMNIYNVDIVENYQITTQQYIDRYYGQIEDNYNALLSDYNDLQNDYDSLEQQYSSLQERYYDLEDSIEYLQNEYNSLNESYTQLQSNYNTLQNNYNTLNTNYNDLQSTYNQLESTYNTLQDNYNALLESFNDLNSSIDSNIVSTLVGDNYFVKTNYQFTNTNSSTESYSNSINNYRWGYVNGTNINGNNFNIGNALLESLSFVSMYTTSFNNANFTYLDFSMYYNTPLVLEHYTATGIGNLNTQDNYSWSNGSLISCKYINIEISSSIDLLIQYRVLNQDGTNDTFIVSRDSTNQKYIISFENDDNRVLTNLRIQCKYINNNWVTADSVVCNISNVGDDNYTLGYQNGYNVGLSENATINEVNNKKIDNLMSTISSQTLAIRSLQEQISSFNSDYNLNNLMWTIASTPFDSFKQIWNVEFFGVNIASIVTGFLTGIIALWVLKKFFL